MKRDENAPSTRTFGSIFKQTHNKENRKMRKVLKSKYSYMIRMCVDSDDRGRVFGRRGVLNGCWVKPQNRIHWGCVKAWPAVVSGTLKAHWRLRTESHPQMHTNLCSWTVKHPTFLSVLFCLPGAGILAGICWGETIVFSFYWACFHWGSLALTGG